MPAKQDTFLIEFAVMHCDAKDLMILSNDKQLKQQGERMKVNNKFDSIDSIEFYPDEIVAPAPMYF